MHQFSRLDETGQGEDLPKARNCLNRRTMLAMVFKLCQAAQANWRRLQGYKLIADVVRDVRFIDGVREDRIAA